MRTRRLGHELDGQRRRARLQQLRPPDRRSRHPRGRRRGARRRRHVLRHRRHLRHAGGARRCSAASCKAAATGSCWRRSSASRWATAPSGAAAATTSARRSTRRSRGCRPTRSTSTSTTRRTPTRRSRRRSARSKELVDEGKIRAFGTSNYAPATLRAGDARSRGSACRTCRSRASTRGSSASAEGELLPTCERLGLGFIPYFPLASGLLTGKVTREQPPRRGHPAPRPRHRRRRPRPGRALCARGRRRTASRCSTSRSAASPPSPVVSVIAGATKPEQVRANATAGEWEPSPAELAELRAVPGADAILRSLVSPASRRRA